MLGHRGTGTGEGENTLAAFAGALAAGADGVELDVRLTRDGALAVVHDPVIEGFGPVCELAVADLPLSVPLLEPVLDLCAGAALVNVEIKNFPGQPGYDPEELAARRVATLLAERAGPPVLVSSFTPTALDAVIATAADIPTGLLIMPSAEAADGLRLAAERGYAAIHPPHSAVDAELVGAARSAGLGVNTWTVNEPEDVAAVVGAGVNVVITDRIGAALVVVRPSPG